MVHAERFIERPAARSNLSSIRPLQLKENLQPPRQQR
jgi:hypothetical protein